MKNIYAFFSLLTVSFSFAQTTIYSENFGQGSTSSNPIVTAYTGYQNPAPITYEGNADIRITTPSTGYSGASGEGCVFVAAPSGSSPDIKSITISGIDTSQYSAISLSLGHYKTTNAGNNELTIKVSSDGTNWSPLEYSRPTGSGTSSWILITPTGNIPSTANLRIKFTNESGGTVGFRIDDVKLTGTATMAVDNFEKKHFNIYPTVVSNGIICITSASKQSKKVNIYDSSAKLVISRGTEKEINVSQLPAGTYVINIEENGVVESRKFIIK